MNEKIYCMKCKSCEIPIIEIDIDFEHWKCKNCNTILDSYFNDIEYEEEDEESDNN